MSTGNDLNKNIHHPSGKTLMEKLSAEIEANLNNAQFGVDSLALAVGMSRSSLHRKLHKRLGISTSQFIREYRLKRALEILKKEDITASETAYRVGFSSPTYFNTCFHKFYGFTPGEAKSRNFDEIEKLIGDDDGATEKKNAKKRTLWVTLFAIAILSFAAYLYGTTSIRKEQRADNEATVDTKSIAVMPLKNLTGNPDLEYVSDGMTDAVISGLTKIATIDKVTPFSSVLIYKDTEKTPDEIASELGVARLLQGNLQISGNQIKINLQLIDVNSNDHLWSEAYMKEWKSDEIFELQNEVAEGIAKVMNVAIADDELKDLQRIPTKNKQAYSYYLQAEFQLNKYNASAYDIAMPLFEKAIALDSNFVEAYRGLANVWSIGGLVWGKYDEQTAWTNARSLFEKGLKIEPTNKEIEEQLHFGYFYYDWNFQKVEQYYQNSLKDSLTDNFPPINADYAIKTGRYLDAIEAIEERILTNPSVGVLFCFKARALMSLNKYDEAKRLLDTTNSLHSDNFGYLGESAKHYFYLEEYDKSKIQLNKLLTQFSDYPPILMWLNAVYAHMDGHSVDVAKHLNELYEKYNEGSSGCPAWFMALYYAHIKDYEKTFDWLQKSFDRHEVEITWLREEPLLVSVRNDDRYKELYKKVGFSKIGLPIKTSTE